jgi:hypothetical protein
MDKAAMMAAIGIPTPSPILTPWLLSEVSMSDPSVEVALGCALVAEYPVENVDEIPEEVVVEFSRSRLPSESRKTPRFPAQHDGSSSTQQ